MCDWDSAPGRWLATMLEAGAVCIVVRLRASDVTIKERDEPELVFPEEVLHRACPALRSKAGRYELPVVLTIASHNEVHQVRAIGSRKPGGQGIGRHTFRLAQIPATARLLASSDFVVASVAVLAVHHFRPDQPVRAELWVSADSRDEASLVDPFDTGSWEGVAAEPRILQWT